MKQDDEEFSFIKEKIKDKPINKKRMLIHLAYDILCAIVFGAVACLITVPVSIRCIIRQIHRTGPEEKQSDL